MIANPPPRSRHHAAQPTHQSHQHHGQHLNGYAGGETESWLACGKFQPQDCCGSGGWFNHWFRLADTNFGDGFTVQPGTPVSSLTRYPDHIDLFTVGRDGAVYSTFWDTNGGWFNHWFRI
ncbi:MAG: hypothetical protein ACOYBU_19100 [Dermatophilaceae bacterium]